MLRSDRTDLVIKIVRLANLPPGKATGGYFSRHQLIDLVMYIEGMKELIRTLKEKGDTRYVRDQS